MVDFGGWQGGYNIDQWGTTPDFGGWYGGASGVSVFSGDGPTESFGSVPIPVPRPTRSDGSSGGVNGYGIGGAYDAGLGGGMSPMVTVLAVTALGVLVWSAAR